MFALVLPVIIGGAGFGVETSYWEYKRLQMQSAVDAAAYAGAIVKRSGADLAAITAAATAGATQNGFDTSSGAIAVQAPPTSGAYTGGNAVEVVLQADAQRFFTAYFSNTPVHMTARSVAAYQTAGSACVLALAPSASRALNVSGSASMTLQGCDVMANSIASDAINVQGSSTMRADCAVSGGGVSATSGMTLTACAAPMLQAPPVADPYAGLPAPTGSGCNNDNGSVLDPGVYCNGMTLNSTVALNPGVYIVSGGDLKINANANVTGSGVVFYLKGGAHVTMNGNAVVQLSAPTTGPYSGILLFGDRSASGSNTLNGTAGSHMTGVIYFPSQDLSYLGNFSGQNGCTQIVASTVQWSGNTSISVNCTAMGFNSLPIPGGVKLVE
jgi:Flp pilus assembly protein TadG